jgi:hypothetical protein
MAVLGAARQGFTFNSHTTHILLQGQAKPGKARFGPARQGKVLHSTHILLTYYSRARLSPARPGSAG